VKGQSHVGRDCGITKGWANPHNWAWMQKGFKKALLCGAQEGVGKGGMWVRQTRKWRRAGLSEDSGLRKRKNIKIIGTAQLANGF